MKKSSTPELNKYEKESPIKPSTALREDRFSNPVLPTDTSDPYWPFSNTAKNTSSYSPNETIK